MKASYDDIKKDLKTGDIVLFSGQYSMSHLVEKLEESRWSHVAMVIRLPDRDEPLLYEATALTNLEDIFSHDTITGPKVVPLLDRLKTYGRDVKPYVPPVYAVRRLSKALPEEANNTLLAILKELHGIPNPSSKRMIFEVLVGRYLYIPTGMKDITCSGFIAHTYRRLGLLGGLKPINGFMPKDFSTDGKLKLIDIELSDEIIIDIDNEDLAINRG